MEPEVLLAHLKTLLGRAPNFSDYSATSPEHHVWLGQAYALISRWNSFEAISLKTSINFLPLLVNREQNIASIFGVIHRAIADLELQLPADRQSSFGAGDVYDFFRALRGVVESAETSLLIVDPYLNGDVFDQYLSARKPEVGVRLLISNYEADLRIARDKYVDQFGHFVELRKTRAIHDRVIFVDDDVCWIVGQSIKDAAKAKPTYLVPLAPDVTLAKLHDYEAIWAGADLI